MLRFPSIFTIFDKKPTKSLPWEFCSISFLYNLQILCKNILKNEDKKFNLYEIKKGHHELLQSKHKDLYMQSEIYWFLEEYFKEKKDFFQTKLFALGCHNLLFPLKIKLIGHNHS